ncbi:MAG: hypothetical protein HQ521_18695, partial [Bacteroidetes bacterium]|nr:hypothetical protein [Bacteroidota bacterium]
MWLSTKINNDPDTKQDFKTIEKLIREYSDATKIKEEKKSFREFFKNIDIGRLFRPQASIYYIIIITTLVVNSLLLFLSIIDVDTLNNLVNLSLTFSVSIFVLGISLSTLAKSLNESSQFASEYLHDSCRKVLFACLTFLTVFLGFLSRILSEIEVGTIFPKLIYLFFSSFSIGGTIWSIAGLIFIIVETTKCMNPDFSSKVASSYASRKLSYAFLKDIYLSSWMNKYNEILNDFIKSLDNIKSPKHYLSRNLSLTKNNLSMEYKIECPKIINFNLGYRDYNIKRLGEMGALLKSINAKLYLPPHGMSDGSIGVLLCENNLDSEISDLKTKIFKCYRFKQDKYIEEKDSFWENHYLKLKKTLKRALDNENVFQFTYYLQALESAFSVLRKARVMRILGDGIADDYNHQQFLRLYIKSVRWLLQNNDIDEDIKISFIRSLNDSIFKQVENDIRYGDCCALVVFKWLIPEIYQLFDRGSTLWDFRARYGLFYESAEHLLSEYGKELDEDKINNIRLILHKGIVRWLIIAIEKGDNDLIRSLCSAAKNLVFPSKSIVFSPDNLVIQHFILCGKMLELLKGENPKISSDFFKLLFCDKYEYIFDQNIKFVDLVQFYIKNRRTNLRSLFDEFRDTDWNEKNPISGGAFGSPRSYFSGKIEFDRMFIYLCL